MRVRILLGLLVLATAGPLLLAEDEQPAPRPDELLVRDVEGTPLAGVTLFGGRAVMEDAPLFELDLPVIGRTDAEGRLRNLPSTERPQRPWIVWAPGRAAIAVPAEAGAVEVLLPPANTISGSIRFAVGGAAAGVSMLAFPEDTSVGIAHRTRTDGKGTYRFDALVGGRWRLFLVRANQRLQPLGTTTAGEDAGPTVVRPAVSAVGRLLDADRSEATAAGGVGIVFEPLPGSVDGQPREGVSDELGNFVVADLVPGLYQVRCAERNFRFVPQDPRVEVRAGRITAVGPFFVRASQDIVAQVQDLEGKPIAGARVRLFREWPEDPLLEEAALAVRAATTGPGGRFRLEDATPGEGHRLVVVAEGYGPHVTEPFRVLPREVTKLPFVRLVPGLELEVRARDEKGAPVVDAAVEIVPARRPDPWGHPAWGLFSARARTDASGIVKLASLASEPLIVRVRKSGHFDVEQDVPRPASGTFARVDVSLVRAPSLTGTVSRFGTGPASGVRVRIIAVDGEDSRETVTDESGRFEFASLRPVSTDIEVRSRIAGDEVVLTRVGGLLPGAEDHVEIVVPTLHAIEGSVGGLTPGGPPARVLLEAPHYDPVLERHRYDTVRSFALQVDPGGEARFRLTDLPSGSYALRAIQGARDTSAVAVYIQDDDIYEMYLTVPIGARVAGNVVDPRTRPVVGAEILLERVRGDGDRPTRGDQGLRSLSTHDGSFLLEDVAPGLWRITVKHPDTAPLVQEVRVEEGAVLLLEDFVTSPGGTLQGTVLTAGGIPMDGVRIHVRRLDESFARGSVRTNGEGRFELRRLRPGPYAVGVDASRTGPGRTEILVEIVDGETSEVQFGTPGLGRVEGTVTIGARRLPGALLELISDPEESAGYIVRMRTTSDGAGRFAWDAVPAGQYDVILHHGTARLAYPISLEDHDRLEIDLEAQEARVSGSARTQAGYPVGGAEVMARALDENGSIVEDEPWARTRTDPNGHFDLTGLPVGRYHLEVASPGLPTAVLTDVEADLPGADHPVEVIVGRGGDVELEILDENQRPVGGARVWLRDASGAPLNYRPFITGPRGLLTIEGAPSGTLRVHVEAAGYGTPRDPSIRVVEGVSIPLRIELRPAGYLRLIVVGPGRDPVSRARVDVERADTGEVVLSRRPLKRLRLDPWWGYVPRTGILEVTGLSAGLYEVVIDAGATYEETRVSVEIAGGMRTTATVVLGRD
jgi:protocatechuate 3,4-dioxygenase beta subunit